MKKKTIQHQLKIEDYLNIGNKCVTNEDLVEFLVIWDDFKRNIKIIGENIENKLIEFRSWWRYN